MLHYENTYSWEIPCDQLVLSTNQSQLSIALSSNHEKMFHSGIFIQLTVQLIKLKQSTCHFKQIYRYLYTDKNQMVITREAERLLEVRK